MFVQVIVFGFQRRFAAVPCAGIDKEFTLENKKMRIAGISLFNAKLVHPFPLFCVGAGENYNRRCRMHHVAVGTASKRQVEVVFESSQIGKSIMLSVMKHAANIGDFYFWQTAVRRLCRKTKQIQNQENGLYYLIHYCHQIPGTRRHRTREAYWLYPLSSLCKVRSSRYVRTIQSESPADAGTSAHSEPSATGREINATTEPAYPGWRT